MIERVSVASDGTEADDWSSTGSLSADGRFVTFMSDASNLVAGDSNRDRDIFVHDRATGLTERISVASDGTEAEYGSGSPGISADGRFVTFTSRASNLVAGDANGVVDIFVHDRTTGRTERVSVAADGTEGNDDAWAFYPHPHGASISADGRFVTFDSYASNLVAGDTNGENDIFVHDRVTGRTERVSVAADGTEGNDSSSYTSLSADGRFVTFRSYASNLVAGDTNGTWDIFVHDRVSGLTERVSVAADGTEADGWSSNPSLSADGRFVTFTSGAWNLVAGDNNGKQDIFVHDRVTGRTERVSVASGGTEGNDDAGAFYSHGAASLSADGRFVTYSSHASNLVAGDSNGKTDVFVHDRTTGRTERVSVAADGTEGNGYSAFPSLSADGRFVTFSSHASNLVAGDNNGREDIFVVENPLFNAGSFRFSYTNPSDMLLFAHLAAESYNGTDPYKTFATHHAPTGWSVLETVDDNGMQATAYREDATGRVVISYRGTDHNDELFATSIPLGGGISEVLDAKTVSYLQAAVDFYQSIVDRVGDHGSVTFTGHSLGGIIAGYLANITGKKAMLFASGPHSLLLEHLDDDVVRGTGDYGYLTGGFDESGIKHARIDGEVLGLAVDYAKEYGPDVLGGLIKLVMPWYLDGLGKLAELALDARFGDAEVTGETFPEVIPGSDLDGLLNAVKLHSMPLHLTMLAAENDLGFSDYKDVPGFLSGFFVDDLAISIDGGISAEIYASTDQASQMFQEIALSHGDNRHDVLTPLLTQAEMLVAPMLGRDFGTSTALFDHFDEVEVSTLASRLLIEAAARSLHDATVDFDATTGLVQGASDPDWMSIDLDGFGKATSWYALGAFADAVLDTLDLEQPTDTGHAEIDARIGQVDTVALFSPIASRTSYGFTGSGADELVIGAASEGGIGVTLSGRDGDDVLIGTTQEDTLRGGAGRNVLLGGHGDDTYYASGAADTYTLIADSRGKDRLFVEGSLPGLDAPVDRYGDGALSLSINGGAAKVDILNFFGLSVFGEALKKGAGHIETIFGGDGSKYSIAIGVEKVVGAIKYRFGQMKETVENVAVAARDVVDDFRGGLDDLGGKVLNVLGFGEEDTFTFSGIRMGVKSFTKSLLGGASLGLSDTGAASPAGASVDPAMLVEIDADKDGTTDASFILQGDFSDYDIKLSRSKGNTVFQLERSADAKFDHYGTSGDDTVVGTASADRLGGLEGNDRLKARGGADTLHGGAGNDRLVGGRGADDLYGGTGNDVYVVTGDNDEVFEYYGEGVDLVLSRVSHVLTINVENLTIKGKGAVSGTGNGFDNLIIGNAKANVLSGLAGSDTLNGRGGGDSLAGGSGDDRLNGGKGFDMADYSGASADVVVDLKSGTATGGDGTDTLGKIEGVIGSNHDDVLRGNVAANTMLAGAGNDTVSGDRGNDTLEGDAGKDTLNGDRGNDVLYGGDGDDTLAGGRGRDSLSGGLGADHFVFDGSINERVDHIIDFEDGTDLIQISGLTFDDLTIVPAAGGANTKISAASGTTIVLDGVDSGMVDAADFLFV